MGTISRRGVRSIKRLEEGGGVGTGFQEHFWISKRAPKKISPEKLATVREGKKNFPVILERLRYPGSGLRIRVSPFCLPTFADVSILPVISTRFPAVNHGLHVKDKRVRVFSVHYICGPFK